MIRKAVPGDVPHLVRMAALFHASVAWLAKVPFSPLVAAASFRAAIGDPRHLVLVLDVERPAGVLAAHEVDYMGGPAIFARESLFWIDPGQRGRWAAKLLDAYAAWAAERGASVIGMTCFDDGRTHRLFERTGFARAELNLVKVI